MQTKVKLIEKEVIAKRTIAFCYSKRKGLEFRAGQFADYTLVDPPKTCEEGNTRGFSVVQAAYEPHLLAKARVCDTAFRPFWLSRGENPGARSSSRSAGLMVFSVDASWGRCKCFATGNQAARSNERLSVLQSQRAT